MEHPARTRQLRDPPGVRHQGGVLAASQGLYNGFLAAGPVWGLIAADPVGFQAQVYFLACDIVAGMCGARTAATRIVFIQAIPAAPAMAAVLLSR